jgi:hypothetical protein
MRVELRAIARSAGPKSHRIRRGDVTLRVALRSVLLAAGQLAALIAAGWFVAPRALDAWDWAAAKDDPAALTARGLEANFTPTRLESELEAALACDDLDLAASLMALAKQQGIQAPLSLREHYAAATTISEMAKRGAYDFYLGVIEGRATGGPALAGVVASDVTGVGDLRDMIHEARKISRGEEPDRLMLGLSAVGLAVTSATIASVGVLLPARAGISSMRAAAKAGRISKALAADVARLAHDAFDATAISGAAAAAARFDLAAARVEALGAVRRAALAPLRKMAEDVAIIGRNAGVRGAQEALSVAHNAAEVRLVARMAESRGAGARAALKILGRGAFALTTAGLAMFGWIAAGVGYAWLALALAVALARRAVHAGGSLAARMFSRSASRRNRQ